MILQLKKMLKTMQVLMLRYQIAVKEKPRVCIWGYQVKAIIFEVFKNA